MTGAKQQQQQPNVSNGCSQVDSTANTTTTSAEVKMDPNNSPPMAVLPLNSSSKLDQEPNPFEQSFSGAAAVHQAVSPSSTSSLGKEKEKNQPETPNKPVLPPVASITSPAPSLIGNGVLPKDVTNQLAWDSLRTGPLSPSMLTGPAKSNELAYMNNSRQQQQQSSTTTFIHQQQQQPPSNYSESNAYHSNNNPTMYVKQQPNGNSRAQPSSSSSSSSSPPQQRRQRQQSSSSSTDKDSMHEGESSKTAGNRRKASTTDVEEETKSGKKKARTREKTAEDEEKRKNFLERNRIAALKCRQRKKQWLNNLQAKVEMLTNENEQLQVQTEAMREEIVNLKTLLLAHKDCPIAQNNGFSTNAVQKPIPTAAVMQQQQQQVVRHPATSMAPPPPSHPHHHPMANNNRPPPVYQQQYSEQQRGGPTSQPPPSNSQQFQGGNNNNNNGAIMSMPMQPPPQQQGMMAGGGSTTTILRF